MVAIASASGGGVGRGVGIASVTAALGVAREATGQPRRREGNHAQPRVAKSAHNLEALRAADASGLKTKLRLVRYPVGPGMPLRHKVWMTLDDPTYINVDAPTARLRSLAGYYSRLSVFLIVFSSVTLLLETDMNCVLKIDQHVDPPTIGYGHSFIDAGNCRDWEDTWAAIETITVICFTIELLLRFVTAPSRRHFVRSGFNWIDLLAIAPFYLKIIINAAADSTDSRVSVLSVLRVLRLARIFKLLRMGGASNSLQLVYATAGAAFSDSVQLLAALFMVTLICMVVFSAALSELDPGEPYTATWFPSITRTCWWSMVTLTGVGYGDEYPANLAGRAVAVICAGVGIIIVAVPIEVIGRYFSAHFLRHKYSNAMATECSTNEGRVDISRLHARLRHLDARGLLRVPCPAREEDTGELVARYDGKGGLQLEQDEWAELMKDVVAERGDWEGCAIRKTVADLHELQADFRSVRAQLDGLMKRRLQQQAELIELAGVRAHK